MYKLKNILPILLSVFIVFSFTGCNVFSYSFWDDLFEDSLDSKTVLDLPDYDDWDYYSVGGFQDIRIYSKYYYSNVHEKTLEDSKYFEKVTSSNIDTLKEYIKEYEEGVFAGAEDEISKNYDFDVSMIKNGQYFYIEDNRPIPESFSIYYFSLETNKLYYMHEKW